MMREQIIGLRSALKTNQSKTAREQSSSRSFPSLLTAASSRREVIIVVRLSTSQAAKKAF
jgi:hypothetical protein